VEVLYQDEEQELVRLEIPDQLVKMVLQVTLVQLVILA
jgi:hypothetical protein